MRSLGWAVFYDALNRMIPDAGCNKVKFNEMAISGAQIASARDTISWSTVFP